MKNRQLMRVEAPTADGRRAAARPSRRRWIAGVVLLVLAAAPSATGSSRLSVAITAGPPVRSDATIATFEFSANEAATFACGLDGARPQSCSSPVSYRGLGDGPHELVVTATNSDRAGTHTATAVHRWTIHVPTDPTPPDPGPTPQPAPLVQCEDPQLIIVCFDDLAPGTEVHSQYKTEGVEFGFTYANPYGTAQVLPVVAAGPEAWSNDRFANPPGGCQEFCSNTMYGRFTQGHKTVRVRVGGGASVRLVARDAKGVELGKAVAATGANAATVLQVAIAQPKIAFFEIGENTANTWLQFAKVRIDDLAFDHPDPALKPDFSLNWQPMSFDGTLGLSKGGSTTTKIFLNRFNGSTGAITFSVKPESLPAGVSVTFSPGQITGNAISVDMTVKAGQYAEAVTAEPLVVVGTPQSTSAGFTPRAVAVPLTVALSNYDLDATGLEVTQGVQRQLAPYYSGASLSPSGCSAWQSLPYRDPQQPNAPVQYDMPVGQPPDWGFGGQATASSTLLAGRRTIVRGFARVAEPIIGKVPNVPAVLRGYRDGQPLPNSPLSPDDGPKTLEWTILPWVTCVERANPKGAYTFTLPESWTHGTIELRLELLPDDGLVGPGGECGNVGCVQNNQFVLTGIPFKQPVSVTISPVRMQSAGTFGPPTPGQVFEDAFYLTPGTPMFLGATDSQYAGFIDITDEVTDADLLADRRELCSELLDKVEDWAEDQALVGRATVGVFDSSKHVCPGVTDGDYRLDDDGYSFSVAAANRPRTSVAHELFHGIGLHHAGDDPACYPEEDQLGVAWPPDGRGQLHGFGVDTRAGSGQGNGPFEIIVHGDLLPGDPYGQSQPSRWSDLMSYCWKSTASQPEAVWLSDRNWERLIQDLDSIPTSSVEAAHGLAANDGVLRVTALATPDDTRILRVRQSPRLPLAGEPSDYRLVAHDGAGAVVADVPMRRSQSEDGATAVALLRADIPGGDVARLEVVLQGATLVERTRSATAPRVEVTSPAAGARVGGSRPVAIRWHTVDPDGGESSAKVDYSADGGRTWRGLYAGRDTGVVTLPPALLGASKRARVRVRVDDGFNVGEGESHTFTSLGTPPTAHIVEPTGRGTVRADVVARLDGGAADGSARPLTGRRLVWRVGGEVVGRGEHVAVRLPPGRPLITLTATDALGRSATSSVRQRVVAVAPHVLDLRAPLVLTPDRRTLTFRIATTLPGTLTVQGRRIPVDRGLRMVTVSVPRSRTTLRIPLRLESGGKVTKTNLVIPRA